MAAPRKHPPQGAAEVIKEMASHGHGLAGIAAHFKVVRSTVKRWLEEDEFLEEAWEQGRETERQALHALIVQSAVLNKPANANAMFLLKCRHGYREFDSPNTKVDVAVQVASVLVVKDHGDDASWQAKVAEQQRKLTAPDPQMISALPMPQNVSEKHAEPVSYALPVPAPIGTPGPSYAPTWGALKLTQSEPAR